MANAMKVGVLCVVMGLAFYCGATIRPDVDARADAGLDAGVGSDATVCDCPEPPPTCQDCIQTRVIDVALTQDSSMIIPVPTFSVSGLNVDVWQHSMDGNGVWFWNRSGVACEPIIYTEPPPHLPNEMVPFMYYPPGMVRYCKLFLTWKEANL